MLTLFIFTHFLAIISCHMENSGIPLPGKIAVEDNTNHTCVIYIDSSNGKTAFKIRNDQEVRYSGFTWLNKEDNFLGAESMPGLSRSDYKSNIAKFDLSGRIIERIYEAQNGEIAWLGYPSRNDKYLIFTTHRIVDPNLYPFEGLAPMLSLKIMDINEKKVFKIIDSIGRSPNFKLQESPWLNDGNRFVYSMSAENELMSGGKAINPLEEVLTGVYVYDLTTDQKTLLVPGGRLAIASPISNQVAYVKDNSIRVLNLNTKEERTVYQLGSKEKVPNIHWTPDGEFIYLAYFDYFFGLSDFPTSGEKLIEVNSGNEIAFKKIGQGLGTYTWK